MRLMAFSHRPRLSFAVLHRISPTFVKESERVVRLNSAKPMASSKDFILWLTADWSMPSCSAALEKLFSRPMAPSNAVLCISLVTVSCFFMLMSFFHVYMSYHSVNSNLIYTLVYVYILRENCYE